MASEAKIDIIRSIADLPDEWDSYIDSHLHGVFSHRRLWLGIISDVYNFECHALIARDGMAAVVGILPAMVVRSRLTGKRMVSAPFSFTCGPLADNSGIEALLLERAQTATQTLGLGYLEIKSDRSLSLPEEPFTVHYGFKTYRLTLESSEDELWRGLHKSMVQRGINKAKREGVTVEASERPDESDLFDYLNRVTCRKHGIPAQPREFFDRVWSQLILEGKADCLIASHESRKIAAVIVFYDKHKAIYMYGGSLPDSLSLRPNHLLLWNAVLRAKARGCTEFDFGRVSVENSSLAEFKKRWGAEEVPLMYYYWPKKRGVGSADRKSLKVTISTFLFSKMPLSLTRHMSWLYRHLA
jgi:FemAB-related protein (PEP-CTERM system-associated)